MGIGTSVATGAATGAALGLASTIVLMRPKNPSHKVVCQCDCGFPGDDSSFQTQTFEVPAEGCGSLNGISCNPNAPGVMVLKGCMKQTVPNSLLPGWIERVIDVIQPKTE
jgi:hypothetical protein